jgi:hypothetical protein
MVQITIDLYKVGYFVGRYGFVAAKAIAKSTIISNGGLIGGGTLLALEGSRVAMYGYKHLSKVAALHKIDVNDPVAVTENVFSCLEYLE